MLMGPKLVELMEKLWDHASFGPHQRSCLWCFLVVGGAGPSLNWDRLSPSWNKYSEETEMSRMFINTTQKEVSGSVQYCPMRTHSDDLSGLGLFFGMVPFLSKNKIFWRERKLRIKFLNTLAGDLNNLVKIWLNYTQIECFGCVWAA